MSETLKPCPFCGGSNLDISYGDIDGWIAHVECLDCDEVRGPMSEYKYNDKPEAAEDASRRWNIRRDVSELSKAEGRS